jgi:hypothetical protein
VRNPTEATASKMVPKITVPIASSFMGAITNGRTALFQGDFAVSAKSFVHGRVLGWAAHSNSQSGTGCRPHEIVQPAKAAPGQPETASLRGAILESEPEGRSSRSGLLLFRRF